MRTATGAAVAAFILSTATASLEFVEYEENTGQRAPKVLRKVAILGGANLPAKTLVTPEGVSTPVSAEDLDFLSKNAQFGKSMAAGYLKIVRSNSEDEVERAVRDMLARDGSAPKRPEDFEKAPSTKAA